ncbi:acid phosphatase type 7-like isoform X1 [Haliotis rufescens]|uniref:acid phosphatase type 7-like isoform X1 n=2 Tax=Haliotis rufescens TaxID=6454 RepID=UPI00201ED52C|nr:acid phosphatase type 7-like isoform X1 [Haliotis rufescens]
MTKRPQVLLVAAFLAYLQCARGIFYAQPEQIHLSYGRDPSSMIVTWNTINDTKISAVKYGSSPLAINQQVTGYSTHFVDGGTEHRAQYIHRVVITGLTPGQKYFYHCGSDYGWSDPFFFTTMPEGTDWSPRIVMFGDLGNVNAQSLPRLQSEVDMYDAVLHIGDFAYDMDKNQSTVGDAFMRQIQPIAAYLPYMTCPGNHENSYNFSNYKNRFTMPFDEQSDRMFFSFDMGPAHIISFSTEYYFYVNYGISQLVRQYEWLEQDLKEASLPENRAKRPWIITMGHRPMYCSNADDDDCTHLESLVRTGVPKLHVNGLEDMFDKYGVDLALWAHEHSYERFWPVFNRTVYNGSYDQPYTNPGAPVHLITGSAGCSERHDNFLKDAGPWSALRNLDYGYTRMTIHNNTHISLEQVSDDKKGQIVDSFILIKDKHEPYGLSGDY